MRRLDPQATFEVKIDDNEPDSPSITFNYSTARQFGERQALYQQASEVGNETLAGMTLVARSIMIGFVSWSFPGEAQPKNIDEAADRLLDLVTPSELWQLLGKRVNGERLSDEEKKRSESPSLDGGDSSAQSAAAASA